MSRVTLLCLSMIFAFTGPVASAACEPTQLNTEDAIAQRLGGAVLFPMDEEAYEETVRCYFGLYILKDRALAGLGWSVTNSLLKVMSSNPGLFFRVVASVDPEAVRLWHRGLSPASLWSRGKCPVPNHIELAKFSARAKVLSGAAELQRKAFLAQLNKVACHVPS